MTDNVVGSAEIIVTPNTTLFKRELEAKTSPAFGGLRKDAERAGEESGTKLSKGFGKGTSGIASTLGALGVPLGTFGGHLSKAAAGIGEVDQKGKGLDNTLAALGGGTLGLATAGVAAFGAASVVASNRYQESTTTIAANADITVGAAKKVADEFLKTMGTTIYSAQEISTAYGGVAGELGSIYGKALSAAQASKVMAAAMDLAEGSGEELGVTTSALASVMQAYHLEVGEASMASDVLFNTSRITGLGVGQVASSVDRLKAKLGDVAPPIGEVGGLLNALAKNGVAGTAAMRSVNSGFNTLLGGGTAVSEMSKELGLRIFDNTGKFVGMNSVIKQLQPKLADLTQQSQLQATKALFGAGANKQFLDIILKGPSAYAAETAAVTKSGAAKAAAEKQAHTFGHQIDLLKATATDLAIKFGNILIPVLVTLSHKLADGVTWLTKHKDAAKVLAGVIATVLGAAIAVFVAKKVTAFIGGVQAMIASLGRMVGVSSATAAAISADSTVMSGSFMSTAAASSTAAGQITIGETTIATAVTEADATIEAANAAAGASFTAMLGPIAAVAAAVYALNEILPQGENVESLLGGNQPGESGKEGEGFMQRHGQLGARSTGANPNVTKYSKVAEEAAAKYHIPVGLLLAQINQESGGTESTSSAGARGITQFIPGTAKQYGVHYGTSPSAIRSQIEGAAHYDADLGARHNARLALEKYNGAPGSSESTTYAKNILSQQHLYEKHAGALHKNTAAIEHHTKALTGTGTLPSSLTEHHKKAVHKAAQKAFEPYHPHGGSTGFFEAPGTNYTKGKEPEIAARLDALGKALHLRLTGVSGYRTPGHSVAVGGFADDPHTKGLASDTPGIEKVSERILRKFGLTRPFSGAKEADHIQLAPGVQALVHGGKAVGASGDELKKVSAALEAITKAEEKKRTADQKSGTSTLNKMVAAIHAGGVKELQKVVGNVHDKTMKQIEKDHSSSLGKLLIKLHEDHAAGLDKLAKKLVEVHAKALEALNKALIKAAEKAQSDQMKSEDKINTDAAEGRAQQISDWVKIEIDRAAEAGKTGADLAVAQAQTNLDMVKNANDAAIGAAKIALDHAEGHGELVEAVAQQALVNAENQAKVSEAEAQGGLDLANDRAQLAQQAQTEATEKQTKATEELTKATEMANAPPPVPPNYTFQIFGGNGMTPQELMAEVGWTLKTGGLPQAAPTVKVPA
jgi:TP901 family phage tail tape measure protein